MWGIKSQMESLGKLRVDKNDTSLITIEMTTLLCHPLRKSYDESKNQLLVRNEWDPTVFPVSSLQSFLSYVSTNISTVSSGYA